MEEQIKKLRLEHDQLERELQAPEIFSAPKKMAATSKKYNELNDLLHEYEKIQGIAAAKAEAEKIISQETDSELLAMASDEIRQLTKQNIDIENKLKAYFQPADPWDARDIIVEIRAGTGGDEAALFAAELFRMYGHYAEKQGWTSHLLNSNQTGIGGLKEIIFEINGRNVYSQLKYESGVHRVQRVPDTEKSGRIHTSAATVAIMPEAEEIDLKLNPDDLDFQATTSSGHGGQSVNTTYSAIRLVHKPTGMIVTCQDERSQKQNKEKALQVMRSRLLALEHEKRQKKRSQATKSQIGTGDRSEKIRTYNYPQDRVTDHRIKQNFHNIARILDGNLEPIINAIKKMDQ